MDQEKRLTGAQINWNQVFYFSEVASSGSIKEAAAKLKVSPSTLSEAVAQLERDLEIQLFHRQHRKLALTPEGSRLHLHAKQMFEAGQRLIDVVSPIPLGYYPVSVALVPSPSIHIAYRIIGDFAAQHGPLSMKLFHSNHADLELALSRAEVDFGFSDRPPMRKDIVSRLISSSFTKFYVSTKWAEQPFSSLIRKLPLLICNAEPDTRTLAEQTLIDADFIPSGVITSDYPSALMELCQRGLGIGVFSEAAINKVNLELIRSLRAPQDAPKIHDNLHVFWSKDGENAEAVRRLKELLPKEVRGEGR